MPKLEISAHSIWERTVKIYAFKPFKRPRLCGYLLFWLKLIYLFFVGIGSLDFNVLLEILMNFWIGPTKRERQLVAEGLTATKPFRYDLNIDVLVSLWWGGDVRRHTRNPVRDSIGETSSRESERYFRESRKSRASQYVQATPHD